MIVDCLSLRGSLARNRPEARYPRLWDGWVLGFAPCLGAFSPAADTIAFDLSPQQHRSDAQSGNNIGIVNSPLGPAVDLRKTGGGNGTIDFASDATVGNKFKDLVARLGQPQHGMTIQSYAMHAVLGGQTALFCTDKGVNAGWEYAYDTSVNKCPVVNYYDAAGIQGSWTGATNSLVTNKYQNVIFIHIGLPWGVGTDDQFTPLDALFWVDGTRYYPTPSGVKAPDLYDNTVVSAIGGQGTIGRFVALLNIWDRALMQPEIDLLNADPLAMYRKRGGVVSKGARLVSIGGTALRRMNVAVAG
jgi:hypothetical protein